ncbi:MAG: DPP IV N-terminal domain-containing protein [Chitinophagaceae bacterium]
MRFCIPVKICVVLIIAACAVLKNFAQAPGGLKWSANGNSYLRAEQGDIVQYQMPANSRKVLISKDKLVPAGQNITLSIRNFNFSDDNNKLLVYTNSKKVWRQDTRGDYWVLDIKTNGLSQLGKSRPASSLMFAKISPDGTKAAYVSEHNIYLENLSSHEIKLLTSTNGTKKLINGTFDWVYEEEFDCLDGFRWSPDSKSIAFWQIDANQVRDYLMLNTTDSIYSFVVPVEYPKVGEAPSPYNIGVITITGATIKWMNIPGDHRNSYLPRMEWAGNSNELIIQQLNRKQNESRLMLCNINSGNVVEIYKENDEAFIDVKGRWQDDNIGWDWFNKNKEFIWVSEKDGWRHIYRISRDGKKEFLITKGEYDIIKVNLIDEKSGFIYFIASPENATQRYLYRVKLDGSAKAERISPLDQPGTHAYSISPGGQYAQHSFSNAYTTPIYEFINLPNHGVLGLSENIPEKIADAKKYNNVQFFKISTEEGIEMDGWMIKPVNFDSTKKYQVLFYVYSEPASQTVTDAYGRTGTRLFNGDMAEEGYIQISLDNRGTPAPKGRTWRKSIYRQIGRLNIRDQALACKKIITWKFVDPKRIAVWGWSGGGSTTLNLLFQYPDLYQTGVAIAAVGNQLSYDNIYQERYMGIPQENRQDFILGSPITYAKNLKGNLLYMHGTGDDNVHYQNAELLINELIKNNKIFSLMSYPNRTHSISEGEGTSRHLSTMFTDFIRKNCPGGGR